MSVFRTKYSLGNIVYTPYCTNNSYSEKCPDCDGSGEWKVEGKDKYVHCTTCGNSYLRGNGFITKFKFYSRVDSLTIGEIRAKIGLVDSEITYMCKETGIGSGTLHYEYCLFESREDALDIALEMAVISNETGQQVYTADFIKGRTNGD